MAEELPKIKEFVWVSIGDGEPEPAGLILADDGRRELYTLGCQDPFYPDEEGSPARILGNMSVPVIVKEAAKIEIVPATDETEDPPAKAEKPKGRKTETAPKGTKKEPKPKTKAVPKEHSYKGWGQ